jgi:hypothetical protein
MKPLLAIRVVITATVIRKDGTREELGVIVRQNGFPGNK